MPSRALRVLRIVLSVGFSRPCVAQGLPDRARLRRSPFFLAKIRVYPLPHMEVVKDLVLDLTHAYAQYALIEPWLKTATPVPERERLQSPQDRAKLVGLENCILCFCCTTSCPSYWWNSERF